MNFLKYLFILNLIFWGTQSSSFGQDTNRKIKFGLSVQGLASLKSQKSLQVGLGKQLQIWVEKDLKKKNSLNLALSYKGLNGYRIKSMRVSRQYFPDEFQTFVNTKELSSLFYLGADLNWLYKFGKNNRWNIGIGTQVNYLNDWKAQQQEIIQVISKDLRITETSFSGATDVDMLKNEITPIDSSYFNRLDYGIQLHAGFKITEGLRFQTSYYQGFQNVFLKELSPNSRNYKVRYFSIGLNIRLI